MDEVSELMLETLIRASLVAPRSRARYKWPTCQQLIYLSTRRSWTHMLCLSSGLERHVDKWMEREEEVQLGERAAVELFM